MRTHLLAGCLAAVVQAGCTNHRVQEIRTAGSIGVKPHPGPEPATPRSAWTRDCLRTGGLFFGDRVQVLSRFPEFDIGKGKFNGKFDLALFMDGKRYGGEIWRRFGRFAGRLSVKDPNDATLKQMDDWTSRWNALTRDPAEKLHWTRTSQGNVWQSNEVGIYLEIRVSPAKTALALRLIALSGKEYKKLYGDEPDATTAERLMTGDDLARQNWEIPLWQGLVSLLNPYKGVVSFRPEAVEVYAYDGQTLGCLPVKK